MKKIGIVILNYKSYRDTIRLISDLQKQKGDIFLEIVVVDNNSPNESVGEIDKYLTTIEFIYNVYFIKNDCNSGYAKGNNVGLRYLEQFNCDYVAVLNNDIYFTSIYTLDLLAKKYIELQNVAFISPVQLNELNKEVNFSCSLPNKIPTLFDDFKLAFYLYRRKKYINNDEYIIMKGMGCGYYVVDVLPGCFIFTSYDIFQKISFFDEETFLFLEERFLFTKIKKLGLVNYIIEELDYIHSHSKTINSEFKSLRQMSFLYDSIVQYTKKYRNFGFVKSMFLYLLYKFSLLEIFVVNIVKRIVK